MKSLFALAAALLLTGCASDRCIVTTAQSVLGVSVSENPATQLYEVRFGLVLSQIAFVPGNTNDPSSFPDVIQEFKVNNIFTGGMVYQRLAVGKNAVQQPGASLMFAKDANGAVSPGTVQQLQFLRPQPVGK
jgi:hypothetical protein